MDAGRPPRIGNTGSDERRNPSVPGSPAPAGAAAVAVPLSTTQMMNAKSVSGS